MIVHVAPDASRPEPSKVPALPRTSDTGLRTSALDADPAWLHGDLHSKNVINDGGRIVAVVDWRDIFWDAYGEVSDGTMKRSRAWAVSFGLPRGRTRRNAFPISVFRSYPSSAPSRTSRSCFSSGPNA